MVHVLYVHLCNLHVYMYTNLCVCGGGEERPYHFPFDTTIQWGGAPGILRKHHMTHYLYITMYTFLLHKACTNVI